MIYLNTNLEEEFAEQFKGHDLLKYKPGRTYGSYIVVPENLFSQIDVPLLKEWMISKIKHFSKLNVYSANITSANFKKIVPSFLFDSLNDL